MLWASRKKMTAKATINRNLPIPNQGDFGPAGPVVFEKVFIRVASQNSPPQFNLDRHRNRHRKTSPAAISLALSELAIGRSGLQDLRTKPTAFSVFARAAAVGVARGSNVGCRIVRAARTAGHSASSKTTLAGLTYAMPTVVSRDLRVISHRGEMFLSVLDFHCRDPDNSVFRRLALGSVHLALAFRRAKFLRQTQVA